MSYYDHATMMARKLGPWANKIPTEIDRDIEHAAMMQQRLTPRRPAIRGAVNRMLDLIAPLWIRRLRPRSRMDQKAALNPDAGLPSLRRLD